MPICCVGRPPFQGDGALGSQQLIWGLRGAKSTRGLSAPTISSSGFGATEFWLLSCLSGVPGLTFESSDPLLPIGQMVGNLQI